MKSRAVCRIALPLAGVLALAAVVGTFAALLDRGVPGGAPGAGQERPPSDPRYQQALRLGLAGEYSAAAAAFGLLAIEVPRSRTAAWARYQEAICYRAAGRKQDAIAAFERVARDYPRFHLAAVSREAAGDLAGRQPPAPPKAARADPHCGPKALRRACAALGVRVSPAAMVRRCKPGPQGATFAQLATAARQLGLKAHGIWVNAAALPRERGPAVAWVDRRHFVTLLATSDPLLIYDPNDGRDRQVALVRFRERWDGFLLVLSRPKREAGPGLRRR